MANISVISRRTIMKQVAASVLAYPYSAALASIPEITGQTFQAWLDKHGGGGTPLILPAASSPLVLLGPTQIPSGMELIVRREIRGNAAAVLNISGGGKIKFENALVSNVAIHIGDGQATIVGLQYSGTMHLAAIQISGSGPFNDILIEDVIVNDANYGILRQGNNSQLNNAIIRRCQFSRLQGDGIEWNICPRDRNVLVEDIDIDTINDPSGRPNWGIGVGFAGRRYTQQWDGQEQVQDFTIRNVRGRKLRQLIHVEAGSNFIIEGVQGGSINHSYSPRSYMPSALVACYGCRNFVIKDVCSDTGDILLYAGVAGGKYVVPSSDFTLKDVYLGDGNLKTEMGGINSYARLERVVVKNGIVHFQGAVANLDAHDVKTRNLSNAFEQRLEFLEGSLSSFKPSKTVSRFSELHGT